MSHKRRASTPVEEPRPTGHESKIETGEVHPGIFRWLASYTVQRQFKIMIAGMSLVIVTALYMTYWVPRDGIVDLRESLLSVAGIAAGAIMMLWPLIHVCAAALAAFARDVGHAIVSRMATPSHERLVNRTARAKRK